MVCPVGTIQIRIHEDTGEAEISPFKTRVKLLVCEECGRQMVTEPVSKKVLESLEFDWDEIRARAKLCPVCRRKHSVIGLGLVASKKVPASVESHTIQSEEKL